MLHRLCCCQSERLSSTCHSTRRNARETRLYLCCSLSSPEAAFSPGFYFTLESQLSSASSFSHLLNHTTSSLRSALQTCSLDVSSCSTLFHWKGVSYWNLSDFISVDSPSAGLTSWPPRTLIPHHQFPTGHFHFAVVLWLANTFHWCVLLSLSLQTLRETCSSPPRPVSLLTSLFPCSCCRHWFSEFFLNYALASIFRPAAVCRHHSWISSMVLQ